MVVLRKYYVTFAMVVLFVHWAWGGQSIVPEAIVSDINFRQAAAFLNQYVGYLNAPSSIENSDIIRRTKEYGFRYSVGSDRVLQSISGREDFNIEMSDGMYSASWSKNGNVIVACHFPANIGMMTFSNKIELENALIERLRTLPNHEIQEVPKVFKTALEKVPLSDFYIQNNGFCITPRLKNQVVYTLTENEGDVCTLLVDTTRYQLESLANLMLTGYTPHALTLGVEIKQYGHKSEKMTVQMSALFAAFSEDGSKPYWGVETFDGKTVKGLYVWENLIGGYDHVMAVTIPIEALKSECTATATLYCYVRTDNVKSLFGEYQDL